MTINYIYIKDIHCRILNIILSRIWCVQSFINKIILKKCLKWVEFPALERFKKISVKWNHNLLFHRNWRKNLIWNRYSIVFFNYKNIIGSIVVYLCCQNTCIKIQHIYFYCKKDICYFTLLKHKKWHNKIKSLLGH